MIIDEGSGDYPYVQLANWLRGQIEAGEIGPRLPTVEQLAEQSGLSGNTVQRALRLLKDEGLIYGSAGRGLFVKRG